jgi:hypothetical protein
MDSQRFVAQHYRDFLSREPDPAGFQFWTNEIERCGGDEACREDARIRTSRDFFRSVEFGQVGFLVYRFHKTAFGNVAGTPVPVRFDQFLQDVQKIGGGVMPGVAGWEERLEQNKQAYALAFVQRSEFRDAYPATMTPAQFVDKLSVNSGLALPTEVRTQLVAELTAGAASRASILRKVAESEGLQKAERNRASVLSAYFGYLRRNPNDAPDEDFSGYESRLAQLDGDGENKEAEMIKSFLDSDEYRQRLDG